MKCSREISFQTHPSDFEAKMSGFTKALRTELKLKSTRLPMETKQGEVIAENMQH
jgi:hypothetical protein